MAVAARLDMQGEMGEKVAEIVRADVRKQFAAGGIPAWTPLRPETIKQKSRSGRPRLNRRGSAPEGLVQLGDFGPHNVLMRSGDLFISWTDENDPQHIERFTRDGGMEFGSRLPYAVYHQQGRGVPPRPITLTKGALEQIKGLATDQATKDIN